MANQNFNNLTTTAGFPAVYSGEGGNPLPPHGKGHFLVITGGVGWNPGTYEIFRRRNDDFVSGNEAWQIDGSHVNDLSVSKNGGVGYVIDPENWRGLGSPCGHLQFISEFTIQIAKPVITNAVGAVSYVWRKWYPINGAASEVIASEVLGGDLRYTVLEADRYKLIGFSCSISDAAGNAYHLLGDTFDAALFEDISPRDDFPGENSYSSRVAAWVPNPAAIPDSYFTDAGESIKDQLYTVIIGGDSLTQGYTNRRNLIAYTLMLGARLGGYFNIGVSGYRWEDYQPNAAAAAYQENGSTGTYTNVVGKNPFTLTLQRAKEAYLAGHKIIIDTALAANNNSPEGDVLTLVPNYVTSLKAALATEGIPPSAYVIILQGGWGTLGLVKNTQALGVDFGEYYKSLEDKPGRIWCGQRYGAKVVVNDWNLIGGLHPGDEAANTRWANHRVAASALAISEAFPGVVVPIVAPTEKPTITLSVEGDNVRILITGTPAGATIKVTRHGELLTTLADFLDTSYTAGEPYTVSAYFTRGVGYDGPVRTKSLPVEGSGGSGDTMAGYYTRLIEQDEDQEVPGGVASGIIVLGGGRIYVQNEEGTVLYFDTKQGEPLMIRFTHLLPPVKQTFRANGPFVALYAANPDA